MPVLSRLRHRGNNATDSTELLPFGVSDLGVGELVAEEVPVVVSRHRRPLGTRLRAIAQRQAALSAAVALLFVAAAATVLAPISGPGCPAAFAALNATPRHLPGGQPPTEDAGTIQADTAAVDNAQQAVDAAQQALTDAQNQAQKASDLQSQADQAQTNVDTSSSDSASLTVESDQSTVDGDQSALQEDQNQLSSDQSMLSSDQQAGLDTSYDQQSIANDQSQIQSAKDQLAKDQAQLATDQKSADQAAAAAKAAQSNADNLTQQAQTTQSQADAAQTKAQAQLDQASAALDQAQSSQTQDEQSAKAAAATWAHLHRLEVADVRAQNAAAADCKVPATREGAVAGGLALTALLLLAVGVATGRARRIAAT